MSGAQNSLPAGAHGGQGSQDAKFTRIVEVGTFSPLDLNDPAAIFSALVGVASAPSMDSMDQGFDPPNDDPDPQENPRIPAGYTYFGQFIDHDLTFDTTSTLDNAEQRPNDERTPRLDLDCLYGLGFASAPYMYDGATGKMVTNPNGYDLPRAGNDRAIIGDPRNDENSIVCQLQRGFINFHNKVVDAVTAKGVKPGEAAFKAAQREVRWTYQMVILNDYLKRVVCEKVRNNYLNATGAAGEFLLYPNTKWDALPLEFTAAAYRFGHSMIRNAYRLNLDAPSAQHIFEPVDDPIKSLVGFGSLHVSHNINWRLLLPDPKNPDTAPGNAPALNSVHGPGRLQFAYKLDTNIVNPLLALPPRIAGGALPPFGALAARNLMRGYNFRLPSGQDVAAMLGIAQEDQPNLVIRTPNGWKSFDAIPGIDAASAAALTATTPLWLYVLMEAQASIPPATPFDDDSLAHVKTCLGPVGGRILLEVFYGILIADNESVLADPESENWVPLVNADRNKMTLWDILKYAGEIPDIP